MAPLFASSSAYAGVKYGAAQGLSIVTPASSAGQALSDSLASIPSLQYQDQVLAEGFWILRLRLRMTYSNNSWCVIGIIARSN